MGKIRITTYDDLSILPEDGATLVQLEDRLVEASTEFAAGPKKKHEGPIRIDYLMENRDDVEGLVKYLNELALDLPISEKAKKTYERKTQSSSLLEQEPLMELITLALQKNKYQEDLIDWLRTYNFVFLSQEHIDELSKVPGKEFPWKLKLDKTKEPKAKRLHTNYQFMVRQLKEAKDPRNNKYDPQLAFGFKLFGDKYPKVIIYLYGKYYKRIELHWKDAKEINFKIKEKFYKFPEAMTYPERAKWRVEDKKLLNNPEMQPSKFYLRWKEYITILKAQPTKDDKKKKKLD